MRVWSILGISATIACGVLEAANSGNSVNVFKNNANEQPTTIRVLILQDSGGALMEVHGSYNIFDPYKDSPYTRRTNKLSSRLVSKRNYIVPVADGLKWGETFAGIYQLKIVPDSPQTTISINGIEYKGSITIYQIDGKLNIVNEVNVDDYVHSQLSSAHKDNLGAMSRESLSALVIAARSDAHYKVLHSKNPYFDVVADQEGYEGHAATTPGSPLAQTVENSRGMILCDHSGAPYKTRCFDSAKGWNHQKANQLANQGMIASHILNQLYPKACVGIAPAPAGTKATGGAIVADQKNNPPAAPR